MGYFASGTGFAGIFGSGLLILLKAASLQDGPIFLIAAPTVIVYVIVSRWLDKQYKAYSPIGESPEKVTEMIQDRTAASGELESSEEKDDRDDGVSDNVGLSCENIKLVMNKSGYYIANMAVVYYLEYTITTGWTEASTN